MSSERIFEFLLNPDNAKQVMRGVEDFSAMDEGPVGLGARFSQTRVVNGICVTAIVEVVRFEPARVLAMRGGAKGVEVELRYTLLPAPGGTRIELDVEVCGRGMMRVLTPLILQYVEREEGDHLDRLARALGPIALPAAARIAPLGAQPAGA